MQNNPKKLIAIVGPTASGKTGLAVFLAKKFNGEIVSADSRQVYKGLDIGTGKDLAEYGDIKYHLIDICEPEEEFNMFDWLKKARSIIDDIFKRGKLPIIVGGTGLYVQALTEGFELKKNNCHSELVSESRRSRNKFEMTRYSREELDKMTLLKLQSLSKKLKTKSCKLEAIDMNNPRRLIRFIERAQSGEYMTKTKPDFEVLQIGIDLPREVLYQKIDQRVDGRFGEGMLEEVEGLLNRGVDSKWLIKLGLEYRIITEYLLESEQRIANNSNFENMKQDLKYKIHAYARRQLTWFRRFPEIEWVKSKEEALKLANEFVL